MRLSLSDCFCVVCSAACAILVCYYGYAACGWLGAGSALFGAISLYASGRAMGLGWARRLFMDKVVPE